jgi:predicted site-specific integrase-resolvase
MSELLRIGQLAERAGVSADTIRHYDRLGLLPKTSRSAGGYRLFPPAVVQRVLLIRDAVRVGSGRVRPAVRRVTTFARRLRASSMVSTRRLRI